MNDDMNCTLKSLLENAHLLQPPKNLNCVDDKKDAEWEVNFDVTAAFLGPTLWSKTLTYDGDLKLDYMDLDDILAEDNIKSTNHEDEDHVKGSLKLESDQEYDESSSSSSLKSGCYDDDDDDDGLRQEKRLIPKVEAVFTAEDLALALAPGQKNFDPTSHKFTADDLKPQPMYKKSKKQFVPSEQKDDKYWSRRKKNNMAAKRSRDARRIKENQIALRASFLERENSALKKQLAVLRDENALLAVKIDRLIQIQ